MDRQGCDSVTQLEIHLGSFESLPSFDCVATAGNSFGLMDAGMDLAVLKFFGTQIQERIQKQIFDDYCGEQPVGSAFVVETGRVDHPYVAHAPTMRIPMNIAGTDHVYLATWATLLACGAMIALPSEKSRRWFARHSEQGPEVSRALKSDSK